MQNRDWLHALAEKQGIPLRTRDDVSAALAHAKTLEPGTDVEMARLMLRHGQLTDDARAFVAREYPQ